VKGGDGSGVTLEAEFSDFYERHVRALFAYLMRLTAGDRPLVEDLVGDTFLTAFGHWESHPHGLEPGWLIVTARNRFIDVMRRRERERAKLAAVAGEPAPTDQDWTGAIVERTVVWEQVRSLPAAQRLVISLRYVDDLTHAEIASVMGRDEAAIDSLLRRARSALAMQLEEARNE